MGLCQPERIKRFSLGHEQLTLPSAGKGQDLGGTVVNRGEEQLPALTLSREEYVPEVPAAESIQRLPRLKAARASAADPISTRIHDILRGGSLRAAFQPIHDLTTGQVAGVEALARFRSKTSPGVLFAEAAIAGLAVNMELAAVEAALAAAVQLPKRLYVSVNVSPTTCVSPRFRRLLGTSALPADRIVLELTEHKPVDDYTPLLNALAPLRDSGMRVAIDDTGAGHSSMLHILRLAPDIIKLDKKLIAGIDTNHLHMALGRAMVSFAWDIGATITAEGIETAAELAAVTALGMTFGQGYFLGHPSLLPGQWAQWDSQSADEPQPDSTAVRSPSEDLGVLP